jgi:pimeloyl-CoA dehydrogenase small subunit
MNFDFTEDQELLGDGLTKLLSRHYDFEQRKSHLAGGGWDREMWSRYAQMGLLALPFAETDGGLSGGAVEMLIVMEAFGRYLVLEPYLATIVLAGGCIHYAGSAQQRAEVIPSVIDGTTILSFAHTERPARYDLSTVDTSARLTPRGWVLDGAKHYVLHGDVADQLVVSARIRGDRHDTGGLALFLVAANATGLERRGYSMQDGTRAADIHLSNVDVAKSALIGEAGEAWPIIRRVVDNGIAGICAEAVGVMTRAHEITVEYLKVRKQFGVPIGSFQALQHRAVDMLVMIEQARSMAMYAAMKSHEPSEAERVTALSAAKVQIGRSGQFVGEQAIQLHGGIGITEECQVGHYYRRLTMLDILFGDAAHHLAQLARAGGLDERAA